MNNATITINPNVRFGKPCINGTRLAVEDILNMLKAGWTINEIPREYPDLTKENVLAALDFATKLVNEPTRVMEIGTVCA